MAEQVAATVVVTTLLEPLVIGDPEQLLASQFRALVRGLNMTPELWEQLMDDYITKVMGDQDSIDSRAGRTSLRGNLTTELMRPVLTWKVFLKGLEVLNADVATIFFSVMTRNDTAAGTSAAIRFPK